MSFCHDCNQDMQTADTCVVDQLTLNGTVITRQPNTDTRCSDCGVTAGNHHHLGCEIARCPVCEWQMISCGCQFAEYDQTWLHENQLALQFS